MKTIIEIAGIIGVILGYVFGMYVLNKNYKIGSLIASIAIIIVYINTGFNSVLGSKLFFLVSFPSMVVLGVIMYNLLGFISLLPEKIGKVLGLIVLLYCFVPLLLFLFGIHIDNTSVSLTIETLQVALTVYIVVMTIDLFRSKPAP